MAIWFAVNGGNWNNDPSANPATNTGGVSLAAIAGNDLFAACIVNAGATGDNVTANFGGSAFAFPGKVPAGFAAYGAGVTLDPATLVNGVLSGGNLTVTEIGIGTGGAYANTGLTPGTHAYFEVTLNSIDSFSAHVTGCGIGVGGAILSFLATGSGAGGGAFSSMNPNGGATLGFTGSLQNAEVGVFSTTGVASMGVITGPAVISIAVIAEGAGIEPILDVADLFFTPTTAFLDLSIESNRRKFIDANGCPEFLGATGQLPFNQTPAVFLTCVDDEPSTFGTNVGLGGTFNVTGGALSLASKSPCCSEDVVANFNVPLGADPQIILDTSDDGGRTWSLLQKARSIGKKGHYLQRIRWLKMGQFRQRVIRLRITDPVKRAFVGFYTDIDTGMK